MSLSVYDSEVMVLVGCRGYCMSLSEYDSGVMVLAGAVAVLYGVLTQNKGIQIIKLLHCIQLITYS